MKRRLSGSFLAIGLLGLAFPGIIAAQATGRIEFSARVAPSGGRPEPVRQLTFYLLRKSLDDIRTEALEVAPAPDLDKFIDDLKGSPEMKEWMKRHHTVQLSGSSFIKSLSPDDVVDVPEFYNAYMTRNVAFKGVGFPEPKFREKDRATHPEKYAADKAEYKAAIRKFVDAIPESVQGIDLDLADLNPYPRWETLVRKQGHLQDSHALDLAQERYLVAQADTDLDGQGSFTGIAPGNYWIGMLGTEAISGDVRLHWDFPVTIRPGETARIALSNLNAVKSTTSAQNSMN